MNIHHTEYTSNLLYIYAVMTLSSIRLAKYQQLESTEGNKKYTISDPAELDRLLAQTDTFIRTCNVDHTRCALDTCKSILTNGSIS